MFRRLGFILVILMLPFIQVAAAQEEDSLPQRLTIQSHENGVSLTLRMPSGWSMLYSADEIALASDQDLFQEPGDTLPFLESHDVAIWLTITETNQPVTAESVEDLDDDRFTYEPTEPFELDGMTGYVMRFKSEGILGKIFSFNLSDGVVMSAMTIAGDYATYEPEILAVLASVEIATGDAAPDDHFVTLSGEDETVTFSLDFPSAWLFFVGDGLVFANSRNAIEPFFSGSELVLEGEQTVFVILPSESPEGATPRESMEYQISDTDPEIAITYGEIEDFTINDLPGATVSIDAPFGEGMLYLSFYSEAAILFFALGGDAATFETNNPIFMHMLESFTLEPKAE